MRAVVISRPGGVEVLEIVERPVPDPAGEEVLVRVDASALNRADLLQRRGRYPAPAGSPADVPGLEFAGTVEAVGRDCRLRQIGDRVMGIVGGGGHAEYLTIHERQTVSVPAALEFPDAAAVPEAFMTAWDALLPQAKLRLGDRVLVHAAASGVGTAAIQLAALSGAIPFGTSRTADKLGRLHDLGMRGGVATTEAGWLEDLRSQTGSNGFDVILDLVGGALLGRNLDLLAPGGRIVIIGTMAGAIAELDLRKLMLSRGRILGTVLRARPLEEKIALARAFSREVLPHLESGGIRPLVDRVYPFSDVRAAHKRMEENLNTGKIVLVW